MDLERFVQTLVESKGLTIKLLQVVLQDTSMFV